MRIRLPSLRRRRSKSIGSDGSVASTAGVLVIDCAPNIRDRSRKVVKSIANPVVPVPMLVIEPIESC